MHARPALVGRDAELAQLARAAERARRGTGSLVLLAREAGVGKTRLADEAAAASAALVLRGTASNSAASPYGPIVSALRLYLRAPRADPRAAAVRSDRQRAAAVPALAARGPGHLRAAARAPCAPATGARRAGRR